MAGLPAHLRLRRTRVVGVPWACRLRARRADGHTRRVARVVALVTAGFTVMGCADPEKTVVVYTSLDVEVAAWAEDAFHEAAPDFHAQVIPVSGAYALQALGSGIASSPEPDVRAEGALTNVPKPDVWWGAPSWRLAQGAAAGVLVRMDVPPAWTSTVPPELRDPGGRWWATSADPLVVAFNTESVTRSRAPRDWLDLLHPRWSGEIILPDLGLSDALTPLLAHHLWEAHVQYGDALQGMDWFARMDAWRGGYSPSPAEAVRALGAGEGLLAIVPLSAAEAARASGAPVEYRLPETGTPVLLEGVALAQGATHTEAARAFLEWVGSPEAMAGLQAVHPALSAPGFPTGQGTPPSYADRVLPALIPQWFPADSVAPWMDGWRDRWRTDVRGRAARLF